MRRRRAGNPDAGKSRGKAVCAGGRREYRHVTGPGHNDMGGYVCLEGSPRSDETAQKSCPGFGPLTRRSCGDAYGPRPGPRMAG